MRRSDSASCGRIRGWGNSYSSSSQRNLRTSETTAGPASHFSRGLVDNLCVVRKSTSRTYWCQGRILIWAIRSYPVKSTFLFSGVAEPGLSFHMQLKLSPVLLCRRKRDLATGIIPALPMSRKVDEESFDSMQARRGQKWILRIKARDLDSNTEPMNQLAELAFEKGLVICILNPCLPKQFHTLKVGGLPSALERWIVWPNPVRQLVQIVHHEVSEHA